MGLAESAAESTESAEEFGMSGPHCKCWDNGETYCRLIEQFYLYLDSRRQLIAIKKSFNNVRTCVERHDDGLTLDVILDIFPEDSQRCAKALYHGSFLEQTTFFVYMFDFVDLHIQQRWIRMGMGLLNFANLWVPLSIKYFCLNFSSLFTSLLGWPILYSLRCNNGWTNWLLLQNVWYW